MDASRLRASGDRSLFEELQKHPLVTRTVERLEDAETKGPMGVRRQLLATSLRLTREMSPALAAITDRCRERLTIDDPIETYVYASPDFNAAAVKPEDGRLFIMLSSSLLEAFEGDELSFVMGHELGHHIFKHHDVPIGYLLRGEEKPPPELALQLFAWSRYAEISADRAGAACTNDTDAVARALFRLASGLRGSKIELRIEDFARQADLMQVEHEEPGNRAPMADWFSTHPFSPLRVKALHHYAESELAKDDGTSIDVLEARVQTLMALMEPSYLEGHDETAERMRRLLFAGAIAVASTTGGISDEEIAAFEKFFGESSFSEGLDVDAIRGDLQSRMADANESVPPPRRLQVLRDLCVIARADGHVDDEEMELLQWVAEGLQIERAVIDQTVAGSVELD
ncbi:MAG: M48 family metallopeptidase [Myxococcota bacterium]